MFYHGNRKADPNTGSFPSCTQPHLPCPQWPVFCKAAVVPEGLPYPPCEHLVWFTAHAYVTTTGHHLPITLCSLTLALQAATVGRRTVPASSDEGPSLLLTLARSCGVGCCSVITSQLGCPDSPQRLHSLSQEQESARHFREASE